MDAEKTITRSLASTLAAVAGFAAVVSYSHIYDLGVRHLYHGPVAFLLPLSVDGLIVYSSLVLLYAARFKLDVPPLARLTLWLGILATVAANVAYGLPGGFIAALVSAWPAVAFICTVESGMQLAKSKRRRAHRAEPKPALVSATAHSERKPEPVEAVEPIVTFDEVPPYRAIMRELHCGQKVAGEIQVIMRDSHVDMHKAMEMRREAKHNASRT